MAPLLRSTAHNALPSALLRPASSGSRNHGTQGPLTGVQILATVFGSHRSNKERHMPAPAVASDVAQKAGQAGGHQRSAAPRHHQAHRLHLHRSHTLLLECLSLCTAISVQEVRADSLAPDVELNTSSRPGTAGQKHGRQVRLLPCDRPGKQTSWTKACCGLLKTHA